MKFNLNELTMNFNLNGQTMNFNLNKIMLTFPELSSEMAVRICLRGSV